MKSYVEKSHSESETILVESKFPWPYHVLAWGSLIFLGVILIGIYIFIRLQVWMNTTEFAVTDRKIIYKSGLFSRETHEIPMTSIDEVTAHQQFWGRLLGFGRLSIWGSGRGELCSPPIADPIHIRQILSDARTRLIAPQNVDSQDALDIQDSEQFESGEANNKKKSFLFNFSRRSNARNAHIASTH